MRIVSFALFNSENCLQQKSAIPCFKRCVAVGPSDVAKHSEAPATNWILICRIVPGPSFEYCFWWGGAFFNIEYHVSGINCRCRTFPSRPCIHLKLLWWIVFCSPRLQKPETQQVRWDS